MIKNILQFVPRTWKVGREKEVAERATIETRLQRLEPSVHFLSALGLPQVAAWDVALQLSNWPNAESVLSRLSQNDWDKMPGALENSESLLPAIYATKTASNKTLRDLLTRIIRGELESPDKTPRSAVELVNKIGKNDLQRFLKLRQVLWKECNWDLTNPRSVIYCTQDSLSYPGLLDHGELARLVDIGLIKFGTAPFESRFPGPIAAKYLTFGEKKTMVTNSKPDAILRPGHYALSSDSRYIIDLYDEPCEMLYDDFEAVCTDWNNQGFNIASYSFG